MASWTDNPTCSNCGSMMCRSRGFWRCINCGVIGDVAPPPRPLAEVLGRPVRVYVAGPIGENDEGRAERLDAAIAAGASLIAAGFAPFVPHLWAKACHADGLMSYEGWMAYDMAFLDVCDAVLRVRGVSPGADREVARARENKTPVFHALDELMAWARTST